MASTRIAKRKTSKPAPDRIHIEVARKLDAANPSFRRGQAIAVGLIDGLGTVKNGRTKGDDCCLDATYRRYGTNGGRGPADNVLLRYLDQLRAEGDRELEAGFCSVLSDYVGTCAIGVVPDVGQYENFLSLTPARLRWSKTRATKGRPHG